MVTRTEFRIVKQTVLAIGNEAWDDYIEYLKCRADLNFEVDFGVNGAIGTIVTKWDLILFG